VGERRGFLTYSVRELQLEERCFLTQVKVYREGSQQKEEVVRQVQEQFREYPGNLERIQSERFASLWKTLSQTYVHEVFDSSMRVVETSSQSPHNLFFRESH
jgi:hypothetical protein